MAASITHTINPAGVAATLGGSGIQQDQLRRGIRVQTQVRMLSPVDSGRLRSSWAVRQEPRGLSVVTIVGSDVEYALFIVRGTRWMAARPVLQEALAAAAG